MSENNFENFARLKFKWILWIISRFFFTMQKLYCLFRVVSEYWLFIWVDRIYGFSILIDQDMLMRGNKWSKNERNYVYNKFWMLFGKLDHTFGNYFILLLLHPDQTWYTVQKHVTLDTLFCVWARKFLEYFSQKLFQYTSRGSQWFQS